MTKQAHPKFRVGDCVKVKHAVKDSDFGADLSGWHGRISNIDASGNDLAISIQWDRLPISATGIFCNEPFFLISDQVRETRNFIEVIRAIGRGNHVLEDIATAAAIGDTATR